MHHMTVTCREALWRCGGISSVAVAPEYRQRGVGSAMMTWALAHMRASGLQVTVLHAARESYYRRFGTSGEGIVGVEVGVCSLIDRMVCANPLLRHTCPQCSSRGSVRA